MNPHYNKLCAIIRDNAAEEVSVTLPLGKWAGVLGALMDGVVDGVVSGNMVRAEVGRLTLGYVMGQLERNSSPGVQEALAKLRWELGTDERQRGTE
jgi:hypothetical protein